MIKALSLGIGAGLVSALLFSVVATGSPPGILLLYLAPLPILIVALGWHHLLGLLAVATGALAISVYLRSSAGLAFAIGAALPAWGLAYLALLSWPRRVGATTAPAPEAAWLPPGLLLLAVGGAGAFVALVSAIAIGDGDHDAYRATLGGLVERFIRLQARIAPDAPLPTVAGLPGADIVSALVTLAPAGLATLITLVLVANLWAAAKTVSVSGRLPRPWPDLPSTRMPRMALLIVGAGALLALLPDYLGVAGIGLIGAATMIFALQGLAFLHAATTDRPGRGAILALAYVVTIVFAQGMLPALALLGIADVGLPLRRVLARRTKPPGPPPSRPRS